MNCCIWLVQNGRTSRLGVASSAAGTSPPPFPLTDPLPARWGHMLPMNCCIWFVQNGRTSRLGSAPGNGGGLVPSAELRRILEEAQEDHPNLEVLPFCTNQMQQFMGNMCPHLAGKGSVKGNGGGLVPAALEATPNLEVLPFCTNQMQQFMGNMCP